MTNELNERKINETLSGVLMPGSDQSIVDASSVSGIVIKDGHIGFTIEIDPKDKDKDDHEVDAISGATITGDGVTDMILERFKHYLPYLKAKNITVALN